MKKTALLVLGMHRSGTSALTGVLSKLGFDLPATLLPANANNTQGYFESGEIYRLNNAILELGGSAWYDPRLISPAWQAGPWLNTFRENALSLLRSELGESSCFVLKEPRMCRLMGFWLPVLEEFGAEVCAAHIIRNPWEVANSLQKRNKMPLLLGVLCWMGHVLAAEASTRQLRRSFVSYAGVLGHWEATCSKVFEQIGFGLGRISAQKRAEIGAFVDPGSRHSSVSLSELEGAEWAPSFVKAAAGIFERWAETGEDAQDHARLDALSAEFETFLSASGEVIYEAFSEGKRLTGRIGELKDKIQETKKQLEASEGVNRQLTEKVTVLEERSKALDKLSQEAKALESSNREKESRLREITALNEDLGKQLSASQALAAEFKQRFDRSEENGRDFLKSLAKMSERLEEALSKGESLRERLEARVGLEAALTAKEEQNHALTERLMESEKRCISLATAFQETQNRLAQQIREVEKAREAERARGEEIGRSLQTRVEEITGLREEIRNVGLRVESSLAREASLEQALTEAGSQLESGLAREASLEKALSEAGSKVESGLAREASLKKALTEAEARCVRFSGEFEKLQGELRKQIADLEKRLKATSERERAEKRRADESAKLFEKRKRESRERMDGLHAKIKQLKQSRDYVSSKVLAERHKASDLEERLARMMAHPALRVLRFLGAIDLNHFSKRAPEVTSLKRNVRWFFGRRTLKKRLQREMALLSESHLFDRDWYLAKYPDVAQKQVNPIRHYLTHGAAEMRDPGPHFSTRYYLRTNRDVAEAGMNPLVHYLLHGSDEGRLPCPESREEVVFSPVPAPVFVKPDPRPRETPLEKASSAPAAAPKVAVEKRPNTEKPVTPVVVQVPDGAVSPARKARSWRALANLRASGDQGILAVGGAVLGLSPKPEPDALPPGFRAIVSFVQLNPATVTWTDTSGANARVPADGVSPGLTDHGVLRDLDASGFRVTDLWFVDDARLRLRWECWSETSGDESSFAVLRAYQAKVGDGTVQLLSETPLEGALGFVDAALINPFAPLLLAASDEAGHLRAVTVLPFPSLCRGGLHHGELAAVGPYGNSRENLCAVSGMLLSELFGWDGAPGAFAVSALEWDLAGATGAEKVFNSSFQEWLVRVVGVVPTLRKSEADPSGDHNGDYRELLRRFLEPGVVSRRSHGVGEGWKLRLPPDGVPTLSVLVSRRMQPARNGHSVVAPYVVANAVTGSPIAVVSLPAVTSECMEVQPRNVSARFPVLEWQGNSPQGSAEEAHSAEVPFPVAIRLSDGQRPPVARLLQPTAPDAPGAVLHRSLRSPGSISVVVAPESVAECQLPLLRSLSRQTLAGQIELIVALVPALASEKSALESTLGEFFPGRFVIVPVQGNNRSAHLNQAASQAKGDFLFFADATAHLHDARTLETLETLLEDGKQATASCVTLREVSYKKEVEVCFYSGGYFPSHVSLVSGPHLSFAEPYTLAGLPDSTYPVVGNSFRSVLVRGHLWRQLAGLDAARFPQHGADLDFCLRALQAGWGHWCTSAVTATVLKDGRAQEFRDLHSVRLLPVPAWQRLLESVTTLREFVS
jgi:hypothetical protein